MAKRIEEQPRVLKLDAFEDRCLLHGAALVSVLPAAIQPLSANAITPTFRAPAAPVSPAAGTLRTAVAVFPSAAVTPAGAVSKTQPAATTAASTVPVSPAPSLASVSHSLEGTTQPPAGVPVASTVSSVGAGLGTDVGLPGVASTTAQGMVSIGEAAARSIAQGTVGGLVRLAADRVQALTGSVVNVADHLSNPVVTTTESLPAIPVTVGTWPIEAVAAQVASAQKAVDMPVVHQLIPATPEPVSGAPAPLQLTRIPTTGPGLSPLSDPTVAPESPIGVPAGSRAGNASMPVSRDTPANVSGMPPQELSAVMAQANDGFASAAPELVKPVAAATASAAALPDTGMEPAPTEHDAFSVIDGSHASLALTNQPDLPTLSAPISDSESAALATADPIAGLVAGDLEALRRALAQFLADGLGGEAARLLARLGLSPWLMTTAVGAAVCGVASRRRSANPCSATDADDPPPSASIWFPASLAAPESS